MAETDALLSKLQQDIVTLTMKVAQIEDDTGSVVMIQGRLLNSINELQASVLKTREALLKVRERLG